MQHCRLYTAPCLPLYLTETKLPLLPSTLLTPLVYVPPSTQNPSLTLCSFCPLHSLSLSIWQHALALPMLLPLSSSFTLHTLCLCAMLSLTNTHAWRLLFTHTQRCVPPSRPPRLQALSFLKIFLFSVCLCLYLFLCHSVCHCVSGSLTASLLLGLVGRLTCVQGDGRSAASLKVALSSGEEKRGWGLCRGGGVFLGGTTVSRGVSLPTRKREQARGSRLVIFH